MSTSTRQLAAIMFTDIVGYTALMGEDEDRAFQLLGKNRQIQKPIIEKYRGKWLKEIGDGVLASFSAVSDAVYCAKEIQEACQNVHDLKLRIGIHQGEVVFEGDDVFGDGVNIASRLESIAPVNGIYVSESVYRNIQNKKGIDTEFVKEETLKNVRYPVKIYQIKLQGIEVPEVSSDKDSTQKSGHQVRKKYNNKKAILIPLFIVIISILTYLIPIDIFKRKTSINPEKDISIAILPIKYLGEKEENSWIAAGITEEIRTNLSRIPNVKVTPGFSSAFIYSQSSAFIYSQDQNEMQTVSEKLGVRYLVEGSMQIIGNKAQLNMSLIDAPNDEIGFNEQYSFTLNDVFEIQHKIASQITVKIRPTFVTFLAFEKNERVDQIAYEKYLHGRYIWTSMMELNLNRNEIESNYMDAISIDPDFSLPYAGLAELYLNLAHIGLPGIEMLPLSMEYAEKCMELDSNSFLALSAYADCQYHYNYAWDVSEIHFQRAFNINPNDVMGLLYYSGMLSAMNRHKEAVEIIERAVIADPYNLMPLSWKLRTYYWSRDFENAQNLFNSIYSMYPEINYGWIWMDLPLIFPHSNYIDVLKKIVHKMPNYYTKVGLAIAYAKNGDSDSAEDIRQQLTSNLIKSAPSYLAKIDMLLGEHERAIEMIQLGYKLRDASLQWVNTDFVFDPLRDDPRFKDIIRKMNLDNLNP
jgi:TolB-like protein